MRTFIAVPSLEYVPALFTQSLAMLRRAGDTQVGFEVGSLVYVARNELARAAIKCEADQILWLDSDMVFTPDLLEKMQSVSKANDIDILTALCFRRKHPFTPTIFDKLTYDQEKQKCHFTQILSIPEELFEVGGCGFLKRSHGDGRPYERLGTVRRSNVRSSPGHGRRHQFLLQSPGMRL